MYIRAAGIARVPTRRKMLSELFQEEARLAALSITSPLHLYFDDMIMLAPEAVVKIQQDDYAEAF